MTERAETIDKHSAPITPPVPRTPWKRGAFWWGGAEEVS
jgi:hypothetical protein